MRTSWTVGEGSLELRYPERNLEHVLLENNGPQIVTLRDPTNRYIGVASDEDDRFVRWIHAKVSDLEWQALIRGLTPLRDVFLKPHVWIVDEYTDGTRVRGQETDGTTMNERDLPKDGALMPSAVREAFARELPTHLPERMLRFQQQKAAARAIDLAAMAKAAAAYQSLWSACSASANEQGSARADLRKRSRLQALAPMAASFGIELATTDETLFSAISSRVAHLIRSAGSRASMRKFFSEFPDSLQAYDRFLKTLKEGDLDVLASWAPSDGFFVSAGRSTSMRAAIDKTAAISESKMTSTGFFRGFSKERGTFDFTDRETDNTYPGTIAKPLLERADSMSVVISDDEIYEVTIAVRIIMHGDGSDEPRYELVAFSKTAPPDWDK